MKENGKQYTQWKLHLREIWVIKLGFVSPNVRLNL